LCHHSPAPGCSGAPARCRATRFSRNADAALEDFPNLEPDTGNELFWKIYSGLPVAEKAVLKLTHQLGIGIDIRQDVVSNLQVGEATVLRR
jgi:hypothetical protein